MVNGFAGTDSLIGTTVDERFTVVSLISKGGLSVLYKGIDKTTNRPVTVRVLLSDRLSDKESMNRFGSAVKLMENVKHPNIVAVIGSGVTNDGAPYLVLPFIEGRSVREMIERDGPMPISTALPIIRDIASALEFSHLNGIIHRNLKPSNMLITNMDGAPHAVLTGFGIAKKDLGKEDLAQTTKVVGSPLFMSPEQFINSKVDARSDIYSLGCVIHSMLSGAPPFEAPTLLQLMSAHHHNYREHFRADLRVPDYVDDILDAATLKMPANRYQNVSQIVTDLENKSCSIDLAGAREREPMSDDLITKKQRQIRSFGIVAVASILILTMIIFIAAFDAMNKPVPPASNVSIHDLLREK